jgi:hypothetical protein
VAGSEGVTVDVSSAIRSSPGTEQAAEQASVSPGREPSSKATPGGSRGEGSGGGRKPAAGKGKAKKKGKIAKMKKTKKKGERGRVHGVQRDNK